MWARLLLNAFVVIVGSLILSGAVNTAIIGSNGVLNRVAEDGVVPQWFLKPHRRYGTTHRMLMLIVGLQLVTIFASRGDVIVLGEAYAFGVVWSFVLDDRVHARAAVHGPRAREFRVPLNLRFGRRELPIGLGLVFLVLALSAVANLLTKETATKWGVGFTLCFLAVFVVTERLRWLRQRGAKHEHLEQFNCSSAEMLSPEVLGLASPYRKLVAIRSPYSMSMLEKALTETDPDTTDLVVMTARLTGGDAAFARRRPDRLRPAVDDGGGAKGRAGRQAGQAPDRAYQQPAVRDPAGRHGAAGQEVVLGASNKYTAEEQLDLVSLYWLSLHGGELAPLTVRIVSRTRDLSFDLGGGNRIPTITEHKARSVAELRRSEAGVNRVLLVHDGGQASHDLFQMVFTMLDEQVGLTVVQIPLGEAPRTNGHDLVSQAQKQAERLHRPVEFQRLESDLGNGLAVRRPRRLRSDHLLRARGAGHRRR